MSDLPIKVLGRNEVQVGERVVDRRYVEDGRDGIKVQGGLCGTVERFGWQEILRRMDEREEPKPAEKPMLKPGTPCAERGCETDKHKFKAGDWFDIRYPNGVGHGPHQCEHVGENGCIVYTDNRQHRTIAWQFACHVPAPKEVKPDPFQGEHWDANQISQASVDDKSWSAYRRDCDLRDEFRRMREGK